MIMRKDYQLSMIILETSMQVTITIDGSEETYSGDYDKLHNKNWDKIVRDLLDEVKDYNDSKVEEIPMFEGTLKELNDLKI